MSDKMPVSEVLAVLDELLSNVSHAPLAKARAAIAELASEVERLRIFHDASASCLNELTAERDALRGRVKELERACEEKNRVIAEINSDWGGCKELQDAMNYEGKEPT